MQQRYFDVPFALSGDQTAIPDALQVDGSVSFQQGWGPAYQADLATDPSAKAIDRSTMNWMLGAITEALAALQQTGVPEWITSAQNGGSPYSYGKGSVVLYSSAGTPPFTKYVSLIASNTDTPGLTSSWQVVADAISTSSQASAGIDNTTIMTPARVAQQDALRALLAGSTSQAFNVAAATTNTHAVRAEQAAGVVGTSRNLRASLTAAGSSVTYLWDECVVETLLAGNRFCLPATASAILNIGTTGAGGMDAGAPPASGWVAIYAIYNPSTSTVSLLGHAITGSAVATETYAYGSMPSGYIYSALIGVWPTNGSSQLVPGQQRERTFAPATPLTLLLTTASVANATLSASVLPANTRSITGQLRGEHTAATAAGIQVTLTTDNLGSNAQSVAGILTSGGTLIGNFSKLLVVTAQTLYYTTTSGGTSPKFTIICSTYEF